MKLRENSCDTPSQARFAMETSAGGNLLEVIDLAHSLRQEQLFISKEQSFFVRLSETLQENTSEVAELAWICAQHRRNLSDLIVSKPDTGPAMCCQKANALENVKFVSAYKAKGLKYQHVLAYTNLFNYLHNSPYLLAQCLTIGDQLSRDVLSADQTNIITQTIVSGLYGNAIHSKDVEMLLKLLKELIDIEIVPSEAPRRMLRAGSCAFARLYHCLHERVFSAKLFLTATLHEPIMKVLVEDECTLEIDPAKASINYPAKERLKRFGKEGTPEHEAKMKEYIRDTISSLNILTNKFIKSLSANWVLFPSTLRWLVQTMCLSLKRSNLSAKEMNAILTDMVFTNFICPAVVSPDVFGIADAPISQNARNNLIVIGQILQKLALIEHQQVDGKWQELYDKFDRNAIAGLLTQLMPKDECDIGIGVIGMSPHKSDLSRGSVLVMQHELNVFVDYLRTVLSHDELNISGEARRKLGDILEQLPDKWETMINGDSPQQSASASSSKGIISLRRNIESKLAKTMSLNVNTDVPDEASALVNHTGGGPEDYGHVLVIPVAFGDENKLAMLTEEEVLNMNTIANDIEEPLLSEKNIGDMDRLGVNEGADIGDEVHRSDHPKHSRYSMSHDDASIGNTSDNLEAVSEAPSNHSMASSLELEENDQNDNLSDMVSANVSGRGTPNISGRDTPSSQITEGENRPPQIPTPQMAKILNKARSDIDDKFCKFEIKKLIEGDETISIISDTWSTDVLASDSETIGDTDRDRNFSTPLIPSAVILPGDNNFDVLSSAARPQMRQNLDETQSESAWSMDVLASDSEKMTEIDTDDNQSIAAKSDTTDAGRSEAGDQFREGENRAPDSPFFAPRVRQMDSPSHGPKVQESVFFSGTGRSTEAVNGEDYGVRMASTKVQRDQNRNHFLSSCLENSGAVGGSSNGSTNAHKSFLNHRSRPIRQNSSESNTSSNFDQDLGNGKIHDFGYRKPVKEYVDSITPLSVFKSSTDDILDRFNEEQDHTNQRDNADYSYSAYHGEYRSSDEAVVKTDINIVNPFCTGNGQTCENNGFEDNFSDELVEHRRLSSEQRHAGFDGRRNGMIDINPKRRTCYTYENHEIIRATQSLRLSEDQEISVEVISEEKFTDASVGGIQKTQSLNLTNGNCLPNGTITKSGKFTGAIPKSISFDASADKRNLQVRVNSSGFFNKIKRGFKNRRSQKMRNGQDDFLSDHAHHDDDLITQADGSESGECRQSEFLETTEDILAKYRRKASSSSDATNSDSTGSHSSSSKSKSSHSDLENRLSKVILNRNGDAFFHFANAKRKLRVVLSSADLHTADFKHTSCGKSSPIVIYLQIQLAQALNLNNLQQIAFVSEAMRCLSEMDVGQHRKLVEELQEDLIKRQSYLQYLVRFRQNLLSAVESQDRVKERLRNERVVCNRHLVKTLINMFLDKREVLIEQLQCDFAELTVVDEKIDLLDEFISKLMDELSANTNSVGMNDWQLAEARVCIERILLQRLYRQVMFPNDDGDISRDQVLREHIRKLSRVITPAHEKLRIPQEYLIEAPWPFAQQQIAHISAYKTPMEKVQCVVRCITSIMNLLSMASDRVPSADDLTPVLIYVIIKANPPYLLSTLQYVNCFIGDKLEGENQYWWTQFCSAVTYIKTLDY
ncbi:receptor-mediated endocytosis protein 6 homolog [Phlebotomus argentipes]|uniref:receptor-mediated endocytosis protein 6 homolog n=1 Tax=Phlebotomus argentipes TaxID=94469 RepID=UPI0028937DD2|nr:receptor-mediated endocytosis protein 6 homolog [Phlebotomus argentipes]